MIIGKASDLSSSEITSESIYIRRREFIGQSLIASVGMSLPALAGASETLASLHYTEVDYKARNGFYSNEALAPYDDIKRFNNFYEFGSDKSDPEKYAQGLTVDPWSLTIEGEVEKPGVYPLEDILKAVDIEERIYRLRCVEAWSMVIPWVGFPLADLIKRFQPTSKAKYIQFETLYRPAEMPGQRSRTSTIDWPYVEGLRLDEAMNPLAFIAVGLYGKELPKQNGAPLRLVVPWKYGFKSIKSIVKIRFLEKIPMTTWVSLASSEYGFYANVNPAADHPRWSQGSERRLPSNFFSPNRIPTKAFNGYAEQVAHLYTGMDLHKYY
jgi:sulfoxide reductase catalytic subunit YedY